jgi:hypothetical protein
LPHSLIPSLFDPGSPVSFLLMRSNRPIPQPENKPPNRPLRRHARETCQIRP